MNAKERALIEQVQWSGGGDEACCLWCGEEQLPYETHSETCEMAKVMGWKVESDEARSARFHRDFVRRGGTYVTEGPFTGLMVEPVDDFTLVNPWPEINP